MEASALTHASRLGLLVRRSPVLRLEGDERLVALIRAGHDRAFEVLFDRYHARLLAFCSSMLKSRQDAEDVLQEVFANAHAAMLADQRRINVRPWIYRIARNRCLNHLRRRVAQGQDSMDIHPHANGTTTAERVLKREDLRQLLVDVGTLPETQRAALLLREVEQLSYEEIAQAMETTIPAVKSLLVRARITLAESSQARLLTCDEVRLTLAEAAEGVGKADGTIRAHVRSCEQCRSFRNQLRSDKKSLAAILPIGPLALLKHGLLAKLFGGAGGTGTASGGAAGGTAAAGTIGGGAAGGASTASGLGMIGGAIGAKAVAGVATAALLTAGAVEVHHVVVPSTPATSPARVSHDSVGLARTGDQYSFESRLAAVSSPLAGTHRRTQPPALPQTAPAGGPAAGADAAGNDAATTGTDTGSSGDAAPVPPEVAIGTTDEFAPSTPPDETDRGTPDDDGGVVGGEIEPSEGDPPAPGPEPSPDPETPPSPTYDPLPADAGEPTASDSGFTSDGAPAPSEQFS